jgi:hypothetical protein
MRQESFGLRGWWRALSLSVFIGATGLAVFGCGEPAPIVDIDSPPPEWTAKFEKEHPEAFKVEVKTARKGKKAYQEVGPRERRAVFIREWAKAKAEGQGQ